MVVVSTDYGNLPEVGIVVRNFAKAPAKEVTFEFSAPVVRPDGFVVSDLPHLKKGLPFLEPEGEISRTWGRLPDPASVLRKWELEDGIWVTTRYGDLVGEPYKTKWTLDPLLFEGNSIGSSQGMNELVNSVEETPEFLDEKCPGASNGNERNDAATRKGDGECY